MSGFLRATWTRHAEPVFALAGERICDGTYHRTHKPTGEALMGDAEDTDLEGNGGIRRRRSPRRYHRRHNPDPDSDSVPIDYMNEDMTVADLVDVLEHLPFAKSPGKARGRPPNAVTVTLDRGVRDFLLRAIRPPRAAAPRGR